MKKFLIFFGVEFEKIAYAFLRTESHVFGATLSALVYIL